MSARFAATKRHFAAFGLLPRPLRGAPARDLSLELFGKARHAGDHRADRPLGLFWPDGERAAARAAAAAGTVYLR